MTLVEEEYGKVCYEPEVPCILLQFKKFTNSPDFRSLHERALTAYQERAALHKCLGWISDARQMSAIHDSDYSWFKEDWEPRLHQAGVKAVAIVKPSNINGLIAFNLFGIRLVKDRSVLIHPNLFETIIDAKDWAHQQSGCAEKGESSKSA